MRRLLSLTMALMWVGCDAVIGPLPSQPGETHDSGTTADAGTMETGTDAGQEPLPDAGTVPDAGMTPAPDAGEPADAGERRVQVFMAEGHLGRTIMSCDDGRTWLNDRSDNPAGQCWVSGSPNEVECDHTAISGTGLDTGDGWFFANFGWGYNGTARRTRDGVNWEIIKDGAWGGGISYSDGVVLWLAGGNWPISVDSGATWAGSGANIPNGYFDARTLSRFGTKIAVSGDPVAGLFSRDSGRTWFLVTLNNVIWSRNVKIAEGNGHLISLSSTTDNMGRVTKYIGRSPDNGLTWNGTTPNDLGDQDWNGLFFTGTEFVTFTDGKKLTSPDGIAWTATPVTPAAAARGPIARGANGAWVSIPNNWGGYYANQRAYRSADGVTWTQLSTTAFPGGHPITKLVAGFLPAAACP